MPAWSEVLGNRPIGGEEALRVPGGLEPLHPSLPLTRGLVRVLRPIVEVQVLAVLHPREDLLFRCAIALQLIRDDHPWHVLAPLEELVEELIGRLLIAPPLHQDVEHHAVLIDRPPQIMALLLMVRDISSRCHVSPG
jgi:hypothetical protein